MEQEILAIKTRVQQLFNVGDINGALELALKGQQTCINNEELKAHLYGMEQLVATLEILTKGPTDYYGIIGVSRGVTLQAVKTAYEKKMLLVHPDKNQQVGANVVSNLLSTAYSNLLEQLGDGNGQGPDGQVSQDGAGHGQGSQDSAGQRQGPQRAGQGQRPQRTGAREETNWAAGQQKAERKRKRMPISLFIYEGGGKVKPYQPPSTTPSGGDIIHTQCTRCSHVFEITTVLLGTQIKCSYCRRPFEAKLVLGD